VRRPARADDRHRRESSRRRRVRRRSATVSPDEAVLPARAVGPEQATTTAKGRRAHVSVGSLQRRAPRGPGAERGLRELRSRRRVLVGTAARRRAEPLHGDEQPREGRRRVRHHQDRRQVHLHAARQRARDRENVARRSDERCRARHVQDALSAVPVSQRHRRHRARSNDRSGRRLGDAHGAHADHRRRCEQSRGAVDQEDRRRRRHRSAVTHGARRSVSRASVVSRVRRSSSKRRPKRWATRRAQTGKR